MLLLSLHASTLLLKVWCIAARRTLALQQQICMPYGGAEQVGFDFQRCEECSLRNDE